MAHHDEGTTRVIDEIRQSIASELREGAMPQPRGRWDRMNHVERFDYVVGLEAEVHRLEAAVELLARIRTYLAVPPDAAARFEELNADLIADLTDFLDEWEGGPHERYAVGLEARMGEIGDTLAAAVQKRWSGPGGCSCECCAAADAWRTLRGALGDV